MKTFLGIEVNRTPQGLHLSQAAYINELLTKLNTQDAKGCPTPMLSNLKLSKSDGNPTVDGKLY